MPEDHVDADVRGGRQLIPAVGRRGAPRRVVGRAPADRRARDADSGRELSRTFKTFDHAETDGIEGFVTITGGKATTLRGMAELLRRRGLPQARRRRAAAAPATRSLLPHTAYYYAAA